MIEIVGFPHSALAALAEDVTVFDQELRQLLKDMAEAMYVGGGVGLAAPQVNVLKRILVIDPSSGEDSNKFMVMINPRVTWQSETTATGPEGCLSLPGVSLYVARPSAVNVEYNDVNGTLRQAVCTEFPARIVQHEVDHLNGITILDRVGPMARKLAMKDLGK